MLYLISFIFLSFFTNTAEGLIDGLYCGKDNCYSVLGVSRDSPKSEIGKIYRQLAKKYHPDMHKTSEAKKKAEEKFRTISTAYEVLKDDDTRKDYDYMLDNPDKVYGHYYRYYRRTMSPKVDARLVVAITITVISVIQYLAAWSRYRSTISHLIKVPKYRLKAMEIAKQEQLLETKKRDRRSKEEIREEEDIVLKKIMEEMMDIRGGYSRPLITDTLWIQLICLPYTLSKYIYWNIRWLWKFGIMKEEFGEEEKLYFIKKHLLCSNSQWEAIPDSEKDVYLKEELWIKENFTKWKQAKLAESTRYKRYRRYMKNHGPGQMSLDEM